MSEEEQAPQSDTPEVAAVPTLDAVFEEFNVQAPVKEAEVKPAEPISNIDPYDEGQLNQFAQETRKTQIELQNELQSLKEATKREATEKDIQTAVDSLVGQVEGIDKDYAEYALEKEVRSNPKLETIWQERHQHPERLEKALGAIAGQLNSKSSFKVDPQLAENHRAAQQSIQSNQTPAASNFNNSYEEKLANAKNENERAMIWSQIKNGT